ncbi:MAG: 4Fe-4S binding protein [Endomicrobiales bacterium]|nr:4Fe-4S binding protein [Endomicrobiales bacterium]
MIYINKDKCKGCGACINICPAEAIYLLKGIAKVHVSKCIECGRCINACPAGAIEFHSSKKGMSIHKGRIPFFAGKNYSLLGIGSNRGGFRRGRRKGRGKGF